MAQLNENPNVANTDRVSQIQGALDKSRADIGGYEKNVSDATAQYSPATDRQVQDMRAAQSDKIQQLFAHDTKLAQTYFPVQGPLGESSGNVTQPENMQGVVDPLIGQRAATGQTLATAKELADISTDIGRRKDVLSEGLGKAMQLLQFGLQAKKMEQESFQNELDYLFNLKKFDADKATEEAEKAKEEEDLLKYIEMLKALTGGAGAKQTTKKTNRNSVSTARKPLVIPDWSKPGGSYVPYGDSVTNSKTSGSTFIPD